MPKARVLTNWGILEPGTVHAAQSRVLSDGTAQCNPPADTWFCSELGDRLQALDASSAERVEVVALWEGRVATCT